MIATFAAQFQMYFARRDVSALSFYYEVLQRFSSQLSKQPMVEAFFYEVQIHLYICMEVIDRTSQRRHETRWNRELPIVVAKCEERLGDLLRELEQSMQPGMNDTQCAELLKCLREQTLIRNNPYFSWLTLYQRTVVALRLLTDVLEKERQQLESWLATAEAANRTMIAAMLSIHYVLVERDDEAFSLFIQHQSNAQPTVPLSWLHVIIELLQNLSLWERMKRWLQRASFADADRPEEMIKQCLQYWQALPDSSVTPEELEELFERTLPWSMVQYAYHLVTLGQTERWLRLYIQSQHQAQAPLLEIPEIIREQRPDILFVIYHQRIDRMLLERSWPHEEIIRLLMHLKSIYETVGRTDDWQHFIACLLDKYKRSRSFVRLVQEADL